MLLRRPVVLALALAPALSFAGDFGAAMHCVRVTLTTALMPATASAEQLADVALARCVDEIEIAAAALSGATQARIEVSRIAMRRELRDYAMAVASGPGTAPAESVAAVTW